ncbi:hypothetical protein J6590_087379 [Homalodisca vitripennis]|nr:hypothetical protein J6590_074538 [Homalodisca vitripennis]KAG8309380.1 hypothetical protein J6590_087379 [Homalodisca vitripennis]
MVSRVQPRGGIFQVVGHSSVGGIRPWGDIRVTDYNGKESFPHQHATAAKIAARRSESEEETLCRQQKICMGWAVTTDVQRWCGVEQQCGPHQPPAMHYCALPPILFWITDVSINDAKISYRYSNFSHTRKNMFFVSDVMAVRIRFLNSSRFCGSGATYTLSLTRPHRTLPPLWGHKVSNPVSRASETNDRVKTITFIDYGRISYTFSGCTWVL